VRVSFRETSTSEAKIFFWYPGYTGISRKYLRIYGFVLSMENFGPCLRCNASPFDFRNLKRCQPLKVLMSVVNRPRNSHFTQVIKYSSYYQSKYFSTYEIHSKHIFKTPIVRRNRNVRVAKHQEGLSNRYDRFPISMPSRVGRIRFHESVNSASPWQRVDLLPSPTKEFGC
jgi:hypothetical protein